jgi:diadenylate cyclase
VVVRDERVRTVLQKVAPGTPLREGIDRIIRSGKGAIIILGDDEGVESVLSGGFRMSTKFTAQRLSELAKMDGALVVDDAVATVQWANVHLVPDPTIPTAETGIRHRTAERTARQTGTPVISVSESMQLVSLYIEGTKHTLDDLPSVLFRANQALSTLERYRTRLDEVSNALSSLEIENVATLRDVVSVLQRAEMVRRISDEIDAHVAELGTDGRLLRLQHDELVLGVERERELVVRDYQPDRRRKITPILEELGRISAGDLLDLDNLAAALGYGDAEEGLDLSMSPRGYRLLSRIPRLPDGVIDRLVARFGSLQRLLEASLEELDEVEGIGAARARAIRDGLNHIAETSMLERYV